jgi:hypothetical protein
MFREITHSSNRTPQSYSPSPCCLWPFGARACLPDYRDRAPSHRTQSLHRLRRDNKAHKQPGLLPDLNAQVGQKCDRSWGARHRDHKCRTGDRVRGRLHHRQTRRRPLRNLRRQKANPWRDRRGNPALIVPQIRVYVAGPARLAADQFLQAPAILLSDGRHQAAKLRMARHSTGCIPDDTPATARFCVLLPPEQHRLFGLVFCLHGEVVPQSHHSAGHEI